MSDTSSPYVDRRSMAAPILSGEVTFTSDDVRILNEAAQLTREARPLGVEWVAYFDHVASRIARLTSLPPTEPTA